MMNWVKKWNSWWFHKEVEFLILILGVFVFVCLAKTYAKPSEQTPAELREQTIQRMFNEIEEAKTKEGRSYLIHVMVKSDDVLPVLDVCSLKHVAYVFQALIYWIKAMNQQTTLDTPQLERKRYSYLL